MGRAALESIAQGGIGTSIDPLTRDTPDVYAGALKAIGPAWFRRRIVGIIPHKGLQKMKDVVDTATRKSVEIYEAKNQQGEEETSRQVAEGKDILNILMRANMAASKDDKLSEDELTAQMTCETLWLILPSYRIFLFAATDTTSNSMVRIFERLAQNEGIQSRLRTEVIKAQSAGRLSYDDLMRLPILDAVIRETLRVDPLANMVTRQPTKDVILPLSEPIQGTDGTLINEIPIARGTPIIIGALGSNKNKALWGEDALEWKPERWLSPLPSAVTEASIPGVYSNLMTFLAGSRACIGFKFSELEMKVILAVMLSTFKFELTDKPVVWNVASVRYPTVGTESTYAEMPMKVSLL
ncbi:cytochrome P450 [Daedalea quercina L-15889]|uniref:Cytochrome P450 n=1 Tax=Daedalea quercina L-15889 TaxID=1314783 RepID=A0A165T668_9APHY|nr:cytochrome P450 [Daedalea quercina L-15889]